MTKFAVDLQLLSRERAREALRRYRSNGGCEDFGAFLVAEDYVSEDGLRELRAKADYEGRNGGRSEPTSPIASGPEPAVAGPSKAPAAAQPEAHSSATAASAVAAVEGPEPLPDSGTRPSSAVKLDCRPGVALEDLLRQACELGVSDLHLHSGAPVKVRLHGVLGDATDVIDAAEAERMLHDLLNDEQRALIEENLQLDFAFPIPGVGRFRANAYRQQRGLDAVFRAVPLEAPTLEDLMLPNSLESLAGLHQGIVLFTGPAGCGKSSTMAALVRLINQRRRDHILTIEDPIEYKHASDACVVNQRQVGPHTDSFARALRAALREDPDVIVIGELRDLETISLALTAAETGHLVLATLHTSGAVRTINRILGVFPPEQQAQIRMMVSESLRAIISQRLVLKADGSGRVPALEILPNTKAIANLIRDNKTYQIISLMQTGVSQGMCLLDNSLVELVKTRVITKEEACLHAEDTKRFD
ncbi:MAG: type IV pilus twitching motility protein PilT [Acidobacteriota bacterium]